MMLDPNKFLLCEQTDQPLYKRISCWIQTQIESGELEAETKLQPVRLLAEQLGINRGAVANAYNDLIKEGILRGSPGRGTFVRGNGVPAIDGEMSREEETTFWQPMLGELHQRLGVAKQADLVVDQGFEWVPEYGSSSEFQARFTMDLPLSDHSLSYFLLKDSLKKIGKSLSSDALAYGFPQGLLSLRTKLEKLARNNGFSTRSSEILICNGTQQALSLISSLLVQPGEAVIMADPGYPGASRVFRMYGARVLTVPAEDYGLGSGQLQHLMQKYRPKLLYVIPTFHAPTGVTLIQSAREEIYRLAESYSIPIFEDEYVNSLYYDQSPPPPIKSIDRKGLVIYVGTFSKTLGAGLRLGWISAHQALINRLIQAKEIQDIHTSILTQLLVDDLLADGIYEKHLGNLRQYYKSRYNTLLRALDRYFGQAVEFNRPGGGFCVWITLPSRVNASRWLHSARMRGVNFHNGASYFIGAAQDKHVQLCFSHIEPDHIPLAVEQLFLAYQDAQMSYGKERPTPGWFKPFS